MKKKVDVVKCPQCGSLTISHYWVKKSEKHKPEFIGFDEYAKALKRQSSIVCLSGDVAMFPTMQDYSHLVIKCGECNYTKVYDLG